MNVRKGTITLGAAVLPGRRWLEVSDDFGGLSGVSLTPAQAQRLAAQLQRRAWKTTKKAKRVAK